MSNPTSQFEERDQLVEQLARSIIGRATVADQITALRTTLGRLNARPGAEKGEPMPTSAPLTNPEIARLQDKRVQSFQDESAYAAAVIETVAANTRKKLGIT